MERMEMEDDSSQRGQTSWHKSLFNRKTLRTLIGASAFIFILKALWFFSFQTYLPTTSPNKFYLQRGSFETFHLGGFANSAGSGSSNCQELRHNGQIQLQQSVHLDTDLQGVASQLQDHPMVIYQLQRHGLTTEEVAANCWSTSAGSSVWLSRDKLYLSVTPIIFHLPDNRDRPIIAFLRGQLYDANWVELKDHTIMWKGESIVFPTIFDIATPYESKGAFFGPEEPHVTIEDGVDSAEPVITFSMLTNLEHPQRALYMYRPFTNDLTPLTMNGEMLTAVAEKNWAPFFYHPDLSSSVIRQKWPTNYIYFVQSYMPLKILRCHLLNGQCKSLYEQNVPEELVPNFNSPIGIIESGTNLVSIPVKGAKGSVAYIGVTHGRVDAVCSEGSIFSPQLVVMTASSDSHFHLDFVSDPVDFRPALLSDEALIDPCGQGRTIIANSISRWDRSARQDIMTIAFSVDGSTSQTLRVHGVLDYVSRLPYLRQSLKHDVKPDAQAMWGLRWSVVGSEILTCAMDLTQEYSIQLAEVANGADHGDDAPTT